MARPKNHIDDVKTTVTVCGREDGVLCFSMSYTGVDVTTVRTTITQPRGYVHRYVTPAVVTSDLVRWELLFPLNDEGAYDQKNRRCDWDMGHYNFLAELLAGENLVAKGKSTVSPLTFMPHTFRGSGPLIGHYQHHDILCAPERPVYIGEANMTFAYRLVPGRTEDVEFTADVVKVGADVALVGPWTLVACSQIQRVRFSSAAWPRGEYWLRLRPHRMGRAVGAYMVRAVWKEMPSHGLRQRRAVLLDGYQPVVAARTFENTANVRFASDPLQPRPDGWIVERSRPWESEYLSLVTEQVEYDSGKGTFLLDIGVNDVNIHRPVEPMVCRIVSQDGQCWQRPRLGQVEHEGSRDNNIVGSVGGGSGGKPCWPLRSIHSQRIVEEPDLVPDLTRLSIRFRDPHRDGAVDARQCFVKTPGWDLLDLCQHVDGAVRAVFSEDERSPDHIRYQAFAVERRDTELLLLTREPLLRVGSGMDLAHTTESFRYTLEDRSTGTHYYYFRPGAPSYPPHYSPIDNIHQIRRVLAVMWTRDYLHWERRFVLAPDESDVVGMQFYHMYLHVKADEAARGSPGSVLGGLTAVDGGRVYLGSLSCYDALRSQMWPELLWSEDFLNWYRLDDRAKMIPNSRPGGHSFGAVRQSGVFTEVGDEWWMTYMGYRQPYKYPRTIRYNQSLAEFAQRNSQFKWAPDFKSWPQFYALCSEQYGINPALAVATAGRLAHAEPNDRRQEAELITEPRFYRAGTVTVNVATAIDGWLRVEVQDAEGRPLPDFQLGNCCSARGDIIRHEITWDSTTTKQLPGGIFRLRFVFYRARLYGYEVDTGG